MVAGDVTACLVLSCRVLAGPTPNAMGAGTPPLLEAKVPGYVKEGAAERRGSCSCSELWDALGRCQGTNRASRDDVRE